MNPNRIAVYLTAGAGLLAALAIPIANLDLSSTAGVSAGLFAIVGVVVKWLGGWQAHEARVADAAYDDDDDDDEHLPAEELPPEALALLPADPAHIPVDQGDSAGVV